MKKIFLLLVLITVFAACKKTVIQDHVYDNVIYDVGKTVVYQSSAQKTRQKTPTQFISILYSDLFQNSIQTKEQKSEQTLFNMLISLTSFVKS